VALILKAKAWWSSKPGAGIGGDSQAVDGQSAALQLFLRAHARILVEARPSPILGVANQSCAHRIEAKVFNLNTLDTIATEKRRTPTLRGRPRYGLYRLRKKVDAGW